MSKQRAQDLIAEGGLVAAQAAPFSRPWRIYYAETA